MPDTTPDQPMTGGQILAMMRDRRAWSVTDLIIEAAGKGYNVTDRQIRYAESQAVPPSVVAERLLAVLDPDPETMAEYREAVRRGGVA